MFIQGLGGMLRRTSDGGANYLLRPELIYFGIRSSSGRLAFALSPVPFIINFFQSIKGGKKVTSGQSVGRHHALEWQTPTPPATAISPSPSEVFRGPYEYSVPGAAKGIHARRTSRTKPDPLMQIPYISKLRLDTGLCTTPSIRPLALASEVMLFGGLFSAYILLRRPAGKASGRAAG